MDLMTESCISLKAAAMLPELSRGGQAPHLATLWRWATHGVRGVVLETTHIGGRRVTSKEAVRRFLAKLSGEVVPPPSVARAKQIASAKAELEAEGITSREGNP